MLMKVWEHLRGYEKWSRTVATVESSKLEDAGFGDLVSILTLVWQDQNRVLHRGEFEVVEESPLYQLLEHDTVDIRFNPAKPDQFYLPKLLQSKFARISRLAFFSVLVILVLGGIVASWFGPQILNAISH